VYTAENQLTKNQNSPPFLGHTENLYIYKSTGLRLYWLAPAYISRQSAGPARPRTGESTRRTQPQLCNKLSVQVSTTL